MHEKENEALSALLNTFLFLLLGFKLKVRIYFESLRSSWQCCISYWRPIGEPAELWLSHFQFSFHAEPQKAEEDNLNTWAPATHTENQMDFQVPGFRLSHCRYHGVDGSTIPLSLPPTLHFFLLLSLSLCISNKFFLKKKAWRSVRLVEIKKNASLFH